MKNIINIPRGIGKKTALAVCITAAVPAVVLPTAAVAQNEATVLEEVIVTGYRQSLRAAQELKREAVGSQDSIVAEDLADFPDLNLADALQRVPGVAITRDQGEGRQISLRGLGPDFTTVYLNGMEGLATTASALDARGSVTRSRAFDFNIFSADLFQQIDVKKSYEASLEEGGIGGNVALTTAKPFDFDGLTSAVSGQVGQNSQAGETDTRFTGIISNTWGNFGALASVSYSERHTEEQGYNGFRWRRRNLDEAGGAATLGPGVSAEEQQALADDNVFFNRGNRHSVWQNEQERLGITGSLQFRPSDNLSISFDALISELTNNRDEFHISTSGSSSTALGNLEDLELLASNDLPTEGSGAESAFEAVYGEFSNIALRNESRQDLDTTDFEQFTLSADWNISDNLLMKVLIGRSTSDFQLDKEKFYTITDDIFTVTTDFRGSNRFDPIMTFSNADGTPANLIDSSLYGFQEFDTDSQNIENEIDNIKLDFEYTLDNGNELSFGLLTRDFDNKRGQSRFNNIDSEVPLNAGVTNVDDLTFVFSDHDDLTYLAGSVQEALDFYGVDPDDFNVVRGSVFSDVTEETNNAYVQYDWTTSIGDNRVRGNIGLRYYDTEVTTSGFVDTGAGTSDFEEGTALELVSISSDYDGFLPTLNVAIDLSDDWVVRGSIGQNLTRPSLGSLALGGNVDPGENVADDPRISAGNPGLLPFRSTNADISIEWYFGDTGALAVGFFYKDIKNFIVSDSEDIPYSESGFPLSLLAPGQTGDTIFELSQPVNGDATDISGLELSYQTDLTFLPAPLNQLGIQTNYTYAQGDFFAENVQSQGDNQFKTFEGLSQHVGNVTLYYETDVWGARLSSAYRSEFVSDRDGVSTDSDESGSHSTNYVDFSAFYQLTDGLKLTFEAVNLTDETEEQYTDSSDRPQNITQAGTTAFVGLAYRF